MPVTAIELGPCTVMQKKTPETDGYTAAQLGFEDRKPKHASKAHQGHCAKAGQPPKRVLFEVRLGADELAELEVGQALTAGIFEPGQRVDVSGRSKGRGFTGVVKRHGFRGRPGSHGHPKARNPGTLGPGTNPSRVIKGKKMPGQHGDRQRTVRNLRVERVDAEKNLIFVRGAVPGARHSLVLIRKM